MNTKSIHFTSSATKVTVFAYNVQGRHLSLGLAVAPAPVSELQLTPAAPAQLIPGVPVRVYRHTAGGYQIIQGVVATAPICNPLGQHIYQCQPLTGAPFNADAAYTELI